MSASPDEKPSSPDTGSVPTGVTAGDAAPPAAPADEPRAPVSTSAPTTIEPPPAREPDRPARAQEIRAAARSPGEIAEALAREARVKKRRAAQQARAAGAEAPTPAAGAAAPSSASAAQPPSAPPAPAPSPVPVPANGPAPPAPLPPPPGEPAAASLHLTAGTPAAGVNVLKVTTAAPPLGGAVGARPPAPRPAAPRADAAPPPRAEPATPARAVARPDPSVPTTVRSRGDAPIMNQEKSPEPRSGVSWPLLLVLASQLALLAALAYGLGRAESALDRLGERVSAATEARPAVQAPARAAPREERAAPSIASLGEGRVVYATADGRIVELKRDPVSNELTVSRVYSLEQDETRSSGDDARRAYSGYYLVDLEQSRKQAVEAAFALYKDALAHFSDRSDGLVRAQDAARRLAQAGGADRLLPRLDDKDSIARRTAAIALGEKGYLHAIPELIEVLKLTSDAELVKSIVSMLSELTGLPLDPADARSTVPREAAAWFSEHKPADRFARRVSPR